MTINVAVLTSDALVLGCDSIASSRTYLLDPFQHSWKADGKGGVTITFNPDDIDPYVTEVYSGQTKMFPLHAGNTHVAAITAGLARLNDRSMNSLASEFRAKQEQRKTKRVSVEAVAKDFMKFVRREYKRHFSTSKTPKQYWDDIEFLIGGFGRDDQFPSIYRAYAKGNSVDLVHGNGEAGITWAGQSDAVHRLIFGCDGPLRREIEKHVRQAMDEHHKEMSDSLAQILQDILDKLGKDLPKGVKTSLPKQGNPKLPWEAFQLNITCANLPLQDAVDFASYLVNLQSGRAKFTRGIATVGGRTHIGVLTKEEGFDMIDEPKVTHRSPGFGYDL